MHKSFWQITTVLLLSAVLAGGAVAVPYGPSVSFGVKGGMNAARLTDLDQYGLVDEARTGIVLGGYGQFALGPLDLQIEALYSAKGAEGKYDTGGYIWDAKFNYFEIPVLLKYRLPLPDFAPYFYAGPTFSMLTSAEVKDEHPAVGTAGEWLDVKDDLKSNEVSLAVGTGFQFLKFSFDLRYTMGLSALDEDPTGLIDLNDTKSRTISVMVGYALF